MWRNVEVAGLIDWMREYNAQRPQSQLAGFYGLDMYNLSSIVQVLGYLESMDPETAKIARERYACLTPWRKEPADYGRAVLTENYRTCEAAVLAQCHDLLQHRLDYEAADGESFLDAAQNARLIASAEQYYRVMYYGGPESWNLRDRHMFDTLQRLLNAKGPQSKAIVRAHNSHIGDARATEMGRLREELNIGQLCRERFGKEAVMIGFGTNTGTVAAAADWDGDMDIMRVRPTLPESYERVCHDTKVPRFLLDLRHGDAACATRSRRNGSNASSA